MGFLSRESELICIVIPAFPFIDNIAMLQAMHTLSPPPRYVLASMLTSFGGLLFGYENQRYPKSNVLTCEIQHRHGHHWAGDRHEKLPGAFRSPFLDSTRLDCVFYLDPSGYLLNIRGESCRSSRSTQGHRYRRVDIRVRRRSRGGCSSSGHVHCRKMYRGYR